jgi:hypothetical protein
MWRTEEVVIRDAACRALIASRYTFASEEERAAATATMLGHVVPAPGFLRYSLHRGLEEPTCEWRKDRAQFCRTDERRSLSGGSQDRFRPVRYRRYATVEKCPCASRRDSRTRSQPLCPRGDSRDAALQLMLTIRR